MKKEVNLGESLEHLKVCFLSNFPPKECGIATFTRDLVKSMNKRFNPILKSKVIALNEKTEFCNYDKEVIMNIYTDSPDSYAETAKKVNELKDIKLVCIQHEFGLFGGVFGENLIGFLENIEKPVVIVFHSVLPNPREKKRETVRKICGKSSAVIVMAKSAIGILNQDYGIEKAKIHVIPHGIPNVPLYSNEEMKNKLNLNGKIILSTFGLLSRGKGLEYMIKALPKLVEKYPNLLYLIIGETHPVVRKNEGEKYRNKLIRLVNRLGLNDNVRFYNRYLSLQEIINYLLATDVYICTNLEKNQIVSGTLSYAMGCGRAVVSTPSTYAKEILADGRGMLAKFKNPESFAECIDRILSDKVLRKETERSAYHLGRAMIWQNIAYRYLNLFNKVVKLREEITKKYPRLKLNHLINMSDNFGVIQFAKDYTPDKESGYTIDDNARALITTVLHHSLSGSKKSLELSRIYLNFLEHAQEKDGYFKNNFYNKNEKKDIYSQDAFGRAIWALGYTIYKGKDQKIREQALKIFKKACKRINRIKDLRARAFTILGLYYYTKRYKEQSKINKIKRLADSLISSYKHNSNKEWHWFEKKITYSNSKLPEALFLAYKLTDNKKYFEVAEKTLHFLSEIVFINDEIAPIGENGWFSENGERAFFDQQPVDVSSMIQTCLTAYGLTGNKYYYERAILAFNWFLGRNCLKQMVYDENTGGCYDGLSKNNLNINQGAESTISYLIARLMLEEVKRKE